MVELVNTNNLGLFDREIVQVQVLFPLVDLFYINPQALSPWTPSPEPQAGGPLWLKLLHHFVTLAVQGGGGV